MALPSILFGCLSFASGLASLAIAVYLAPHWKTGSAGKLILLKVSVAIWAMAYAMEFFSPSLSLILWWVKVEYVGAAWVGFFLFNFILGTSKNTPKIPGILYPVMAIIPLTAIILALTNDSHHLMWRAAVLDLTGPIPVVDFSRGPCFWGFVLFSYGLLFLSTLVLVRSLASAGDLLKKQQLSILVGILFPWAANLLYVVKIEGGPLPDLTPIAFSISGAAFAWGLVRYQMLSLIPLAHETMIESMGDPVICLDAKHRILDVNRAGRTVFPLARDLPAHRCLESEFPGLYHTLVPHLTGEPVEAEISLPSVPDARDWDMRIFPLRSSGVRSYGWLIHLRDITERKKTEQELRDTRNYIRSIINSMPSVLIGLDSAQRVTQWNNEAVKMTGISSEAAEGQLLNQAFPQFSALLPDIARVIRNRTVSKASRATLSADQKMITTDITIYPVSSDTGLGVVIRVDDVSDQVRLEEMMVQSEKMLSVGGLAAGMAHEINNPLAGMIQSIQVIRNRLLNPIPANLEAAEKCGISLTSLETYLGERQILPMMDLITDSGLRAAGIVSNMLSFSRKSGKSKSPHDPLLILDETLALIENDYRIKNKYDFKAIEIRKDYAKDLPRVFCQKGEIQQVFLNILKNGAEAMLDAKTPSPGFRIHCYRKKDRVVVKIRDNGPGMDAPTRKRIFEPFFTTKDVGVGTGLGLSVSYFIITENHGGTLEVDSEPGRGTTFTVSLPENDRT